MEEYKRYKETYIEDDSAMTKKINEFVKKIKSITINTQYTQNKSYPDFKEHEKLILLEYLTNDYLKEKTSIK